MFDATRGHLFVVQGDLNRFHADDVLVPCDGNANVSGHFRSLLDDVVPAPMGVVPAGLKERIGAGADRRPIRLRQADGRPGVWLVNTASAGVSPVDDLEWLISGVLRALDTVAVEAGGVVGPTGRSRRLIAMPLVGIGAGGFRNVMAQAIKRLLGALDNFCQKEGSPDVVLVTHERSDYAAVQRHRKQSDTLHPEVLDGLAELAQRGRLVPFIGAGSSLSAGLPSWSELLRDLAKEAGWASFEEQRNGLFPEDQAQILKKKLGESELRRAIKDRLVAERVPLQHALLASMRFREAITTNYDRLYEMAYSDTLPADDLVVIPGGQGAEAGPWLVKMHGDLESGQIVLTREQYLAFDALSVPLASIVQAHMVTRHLLFVGYSLSDGNFVRFAHQVRGVFAPYGHSPVIGTVLLVSGNDALKELWEDAFQYVELDGDGDGPRQIEIFLDGLARRACTEAPYLLDRKYFELLEEEDKQLAQGLRDLHPDESTTASRMLRTLLLEFGWHEKRVDR